MAELTLQVSSQQVEPGEQHDSRERRHQQLQAPAAQQLHGGTAVLRVGVGRGFQVGLSPSSDLCNIFSSV